MRLVTDTNILVRCSQGRAMHLAAGLTRAGIDLLTTRYNAAECDRVLQRVFGLDEAQSRAETGDLLSLFAVIEPDSLADAAPAALARLAQGGASDWPVLAAALGYEADIWSDDRDFFGVGVPVWSTRNVLNLASPFPTERPQNGGPV